MTDVLNGEVLLVLASTALPWPIVWFFCILFSMFGLVAYQSNLLSRRRAFIATYQWPPGLIGHLKRDYPNLTPKQIERIEDGLRQFFLAFLNGGRRHVSMPSVAADALWHHFILHTREYEAFCVKAFGRFLHHRPVAVLAPNQKDSNEGLRRVWWLCCKLDRIDPWAPAALPLLFALDRELAIPGGNIYHPDCEALRQKGVHGGHCGGDFSSTSIDGGTAGLGDGVGGGGGDGDSGGGGCGGD